MKFQPFGYSFHVSSTQNPEAAKASLRAGMKGWFEAKNSPRGWILGPVICLWASAFNRQGPMLIGWISSDSLGTKVRGRAGSDLNGMVYAAIIFSFLAYVFPRAVADGSLSGGQVLLFGGLIFVGAPLTFWWAHKDRREAEPLVNFVRKSLGQASAPKRQLLSRTAETFSMMLIVCGDMRDGEPVTVDAIVNAVDEIQFDRNGFLILERSDCTYMQAATKDGGFVVEKREGDGQHFVAKRLDGASSFSENEVTDALLSYLHGKSDVPGVRWERMKL